MCHGALVCILPPSAVCQSNQARAVLGTCTQRYFMLLPTYHLPLLYGIGDHAVPLPCRNPGTSDASIAGATGLSARQAAMTMQTWINDVVALRADVAVSDSLPSLAEA